MTAFVILQMQFQNQTSIAFSIYTIVNNLLTYWYYTCVLNYCTFGVISQYSPRNNILQLQNEVPFLTVQVPLLTQGDGSQGTKESEKNFKCKIMCTYFGSQHVQSHSDHTC